MDLNIDSLRSLLINITTKPNIVLNTRQLLQLYNCICHELSFQIPINDSDALKIETYLISNFEKIMDFINEIDIEKSQMPTLNEKNTILKAITQNEVVYETVNDLIKDNLRGFLVYFLKTSVEQTTRVSTNTNTIQFLQGKLFFLMGHTNEAEPMLVQSYETLKSKLGLNDALTMQSMECLSDLYISIIKYPQAEKILKELLKSTQSKYGQESKEVIAILYKLGIMQINLKEYDRAEPYYNDILKIYKKNKVDKDMNIYSNTINNLATIYYNQGRLEDSLPLFIETLKNLRATKGKGDKHEDTLNCLSQLANIYATLSQYTEAEPYFEEVFFSYKSLYGSEDIKTLESMHRMALTYKNLNDMENAEKLLVVCVERRTKQLGANHVDTLDSVDLLCTVYEKLGEKVKTGQFYVLLINGRKETLGSTHPDTIKVY